MRFYDVTNWPTAVSSTKGTRDKTVIIDPDTGLDYFLKFPMVKPGRDYSAETWSEIIAYEVGTLLGFNVLEYNFACQGGRCGCISRNMVGGCPDAYLVEGDSILTAFDPKYNPSDKSTYSSYTFSFVHQALTAAKLDIFLPDFLKMLVFDAIIGNSDRHQGNWGFIVTVKAPADNRSIIAKLLRKPDKTEQAALSEYVMAPIYDSGCCLGREFNDSQLSDRLNDKNRLESFLRKGLAELRIDAESNGKLSHFDLLRRLSEWNESYAEIIKGAIEETQSRYDVNQIKHLLENIDNPLPASIKGDNGLSKIRKQFVIEVIDRRIKRLKEI